MKTLVTVLNLAEQLITLVETIQTLLTSVYGCDIVVNLSLTINNGTTSSTDMMACDSLIWNGTTYNNSGTYTYQTTNSNGCDSTATLNLTINFQPYIDTLEVVTNCSYYTWNGSDYFNSGIYNDTITSNSCDSIYILNLTIEDVETSTISGLLQVTISSQETYSVPYYENSEYTWSVSDGGNILSGEDSSQVVINWNTAGVSELCLKEQTNDGCLKDTVSCSNT